MKTTKETGSNSPVTPDELKKILEIHRVWLRSEAGERAVLNGADLSGANLSYADLSGAGLSDADLSGANLSGANLSGAVLNGANLSGANLSYADLSGAGLNGANLSDADLSDADLSGANLSYADLRGANLSNADLSGANLRDADLSGAVLNGANLSYANLSGVNLNRVTGLTWAECSWSAHDEPGCRLIAVRIADEDVYFCLDFRGSFDELLAYIANGRSELAHSRTLAANFCAARMKEMSNK